MKDEIPKLGEDITGTAATTKIPPGCEFTVNNIVIMNRRKFIKNSILTAIAIYTIPVKSEFTTKCDCDILEQFHTEKKLRTFLKENIITTTSKHQPERKAINIEVKFKNGVTSKNIVDKYITHLIENS